MIDAKLLEILACPVCKTAVRLEGDWLACGQCGRRYPIRNGIPVMLVEEAQSPGGAGQARPGSCEGRAGGARGEGTVRA